MKTNELLLSKAIFDIGKITIAIHDYKHLAVITLIDDGGNYICKFDNCSYDIIIVMREFENYVVGLMNTVVNP